MSNISVSVKTTKLDFLQQLTHAAVQLTQQHKITPDFPVIAATMRLLINANKVSVCERVTFTDPYHAEVVIDAEEVDSPLTSWRVAHMLAKAKDMIGDGAGEASLSEPKQYNWSDIHKYVAQ